MMQNTETDDFKDYRTQSGFNPSVLSVKSINFKNPSVTHRDSDRLTLLPNGGRFHPCLISEILHGYSQYKNHYNEPLE